MKLRVLAAIAAAFACVPAHAQEARSEETAETIRWPIPWKVGQVLTYETENLEAEQSAKKRERTRSTDTTTITIVEASTEGYVQKWVSTNSKYEALEGDPEAVKLMEQLNASLSDLSILVELDKEASYKRIRNIDEISTRMRGSLRPMLLAEVEKGVSKTIKDEAEVKAAMEKSRAQLDSMLAGLTSPAFIEAAMGQVLQNYNGFVGIELEDGASYSLETELDNPLGGKKFPATIEFGLYASEDDPDDVFVEWTSKIDPRRGAQAAWDMVEKMYGSVIPKEQRKDLPKEISIVDEGFLVFNRNSGVIEMYENERKVDMADTHKSDRDRMRLVGGEHEHEWKQEAVEGAAGAAPAREEG